MCRHHRLGACAAVILTLNGYGIAQQYSFRHYGAADGLQNLAILSLAQDGAGYIWAGSEGGLYRYDGTRFRLMAAAEGLPCATEVHALHVAADGSLWINTCAQIFRFDGRRFHSIAGISGMFSSTQSMANDARGHVVVATPSGLYEVAPKGDGSLFARPYALGPELAGTPMRGIARNGSQLWFGCGRRLCVEDGGRVSMLGPAEGLPEDAWDAIGVTPDAGGQVSTGSDIVAYVANNPNARYIVAGAGARSNGGRNTFPLDHTNNFDVALTKRINLTERFRFDIGAQAFNLFNHAQFVGGWLNDVTPFSTSAINRAFLVPSSSFFGQYNQGTPEVGFFSSNSRALQLVARFTF